MRNVTDSVKALHKTARGHSRWKQADVGRKHDLGSCVCSARSLCTDATVHFWHGLASGPSTPSLAHSVDQSAVLLYKHIQSELKVKITQSEKTSKPLKDLEALAADNSSRGILCAGEGALLTCEDT